MTYTIDHAKTELQQNKKKMDGVLNKLLGMEYHLGLLTEKIQELTERMKTIADRFKAAGE